MDKFEVRNVVKEMREKVYERVNNWIWVDKNNSWDMGDMLGLDVICELEENDLKDMIKKINVDIEVLRRVLKNVEDIEEVYYDEYLKRGKKEE